MSEADITKEGYQPSQILEETIVKTRALGFHGSYLDSILQDQKRRLGFKEKIAFLAAGLKPLNFQNEQKAKTIRYFLLAFIYGEGKKRGEASFQAPDRFWQNLDEVKWRRALLANLVYEKLLLGDKQLAESDFGKQVKVVFDEDHGLLGLPAGACQEEDEGVWRQTFEILGAKDEVKGHKRRGLVLNVSLRTMLDNLTRTVGSGTVEK